MLYLSKMLRVLWPEIFMATVSGAAAVEGLSAGARERVRAAGRGAIADATLLGMDPSGLPAITCPVVIAHGTDDRIIPISLGRKLHAAATGDAEFVAVDGAGHNDFFDVAGEAYLKGMGARFRKWARKR